MDPKRYNASGEMLPYAHDPDPDSVPGVPYVGTMDGAGAAANSVVMKEEPAEEHPASSWTPPPISSEVLGGHGRPMAHRTRTPSGAEPTSAQGRLRPPATVRPEERYR